VVTCRVDDGRRAANVPSARRFVATIGLVSVAYLVFEIATHGV